MEEIMYISANTLLSDNTFSMPKVALSIQEIGNNAKLVIEKLLHICGPVPCIIDGKEVALDKINAIDVKDEILIPKVDFLHKTRHTFDDLIYIIHRLRMPDGCEWDKAQTHESIRSNCIEEAYELVDAIDNKDLPNMREETGDVLLQAAFHAVIAEDNKEYDIYDVLSELCGKLIFRHPHVFGDVKANNAEEAHAAWDMAKAQEKKQSNVTMKMQSVADAMPATMRAAKIQKYASKVGFDWEKAEDCAFKVNEELSEFLAASDEDAEMEGGDLLFAVVNVLRKRGISPEVALNASVAKFIKRFSGVEKWFEQNGKDMKSATLEELDKVYQIVKSKENK